VKLALVTWLDATRTDDNISAHASIGVMRETLGWLLYEGKDGVVLAMTRDGDENFERGFTIPHVYIHKVKKLGDR